MALPTCTIGPSAVSGKRCGAPSVATFTGRNGETYAECVDHVLRATRSDDFAVGEHVGVFHGGLAKIGVVVKVTPTRLQVTVPTPNGRNGSEKVITVPKAEARKLGDR